MIKAIIISRTNFIATVLSMYRGEINFNTQQGKEKERKTKYELRNENTNLHLIWFKKQLDFNLFW